MSGVNYSNSSVHKSDLLLVENYAASLSGGGGGGSSTKDYILCTNVGNVAVTYGTTFAALTVLPINSTQQSANFTLTANEITYNGTATKNFICTISGNVVVGLSAMLPAPMDSGSVDINTLWVLPWKGIPAFNQNQQNLQPDANFPLPIIDTTRDGARHFFYNFVFSLAQGQKIKFFANMRVALGSYTFTFTDPAVSWGGSLPSLSGTAYTISIVEI